MVIKQLPKYWCPRWHLLAVLLTCDADHHTIIDKTIVLTMGSGTKSPYTLHEVQKPHHSLLMVESKAWQKLLSAIVCDEEKRMISKDSFTTPKDSSLFININIAIMIYATFKKKKKKKKKPRSSSTAFKRQACCGGD
ncbi:hypothetical protein BJ878DRAFT_20201 [Calycina marina]|uniref:Uncharacterized protein n=1 Tax=Calycina marina TaxID=1763456 RepID=A0A9P7YU22_9HELO|nr:hypothetical protein BJ878DRAFT_20201 [Calycina marina]